MNSENVLASIIKKLTDIAKNIRHVYNTCIAEAREGVVLHTKQTLIEEQKAQARENIGAACETIVANALRGTAVGNPVCITDISPMEHEMAVTVSGDTDLSTVTVSRYGEDYAVNKTIALSTTTSAGSLTIANGGLKEPLKAGHTYKIFADITSDAEEKKFRIDTDDFALLGYLEGEGRQSVTITIGASDCGYVRFYSAKDNATSKTAATTFENITIVEEATRVDYTPEADGAVKGVKSLYPTTTLIADNSQVTISAEYNKDTNRVIAGQEERIAALVAAMINLLEG